MQHVRTSRYGELDNPVDFTCIVDAIHKAAQEPVQKTAPRCINCYRVKKINDNNLCDACEKSRLFDKAGIPQRYREARLESCIPTPENAKLLDFCKQYASAKIRENGIFLYGACGTGKTHIAIATARNMILRSAALFTTTTNLLLSVRRTFDGAGTQGTEADLLRQFSTSSMLILDDLGIEKQSEWSKQIIGQIIQERDANKKPTIITSNFPVADIGAKIDRRIASRIIGSCHIWNLNGNDFRLRRIKQMS